MTTEQDATTMSSTLLSSLHQAGDPLPISPTPFEIWTLPDEFLYQIACYVAAPTHRAQVIVFQMALLNKTAASSLCTSPTLWDCVLHGDYQPNDNSNDDQEDEELLQTKNSKKQSTSKSPPRTKKRKISHSAHPLSHQQNRRSSDRLRRSPMERVRDAHQLMLDHTEIAYSYLWECCYASHSNKSNLQRSTATATSLPRRKRKSFSNSGYLTKAKLVSILNEYGPCLRYHRVMSTGGTFLVEVCRAKHVPKATILQCVKELVRRAGPSSRCRMILTSTLESASSQLTPLCVAAVRAMPHVVQYLLDHGADPDTTCSGRFKCQTPTPIQGGTKSVQGRRVTALEFAKLMMDAEVEAGATSRDVTDLKECIRILSETAASRIPKHASVIS